MIIYSKADCKNYSKIVRNGFKGGKASKGEFRCDNPDCRCDVFHVHGFYERTLLSFEPFSDNSTPAFDLPGDLKCYVETLEILRVKCTGCGTTHGIAPIDMIPFGSFTLPAFLLLLTQIFLKSDPEQPDAPVIHANPYISWHVYKRILLVYMEYRDRMMAAMRQKGLHTAAPDLPDASLLDSYDDRPPPCQSHKAFLGVHKWPLFIHRRNTVSYPLRFLLPESLD